MKKFIVIVLIAAMILTIPFIMEYTKNTSDGTPITITVNQGSTAKQIATTLKSNGLIKYEFLFLLKLKNSEYSERLKYGTFELHTGMSIIDIIKKLSVDPLNSSANDIKLTVPEGYSVEKIAKKVSELGICSEVDFLDALDGKYDYDFLNDVPNAAVNYKLQGFLFPNTYFFESDVTAHEIINTMLGEFERQYDSISGNNSKLSFFEIITMASMIERESYLPEEMPLIAGVLYNRLGVKMKLQIDATVVYAISDGLYNVDKVYYKDLENNSKYNTYKYEGLPIGPISNPSINAIKAAMNPEKHKYLYYHTDETKKDGSHIFTETYSDHTNTME